MKNAFQIILALAVLGLYILHFTDSEENQQEGEKSTQVAAKKSNANTGNIAYVNTDSLWQKYDYYQEMIDDLLTEKETLEKQYENRVRKLEEKVVRFREKAPYLSQREGERQQTAIMQEEQQVVQLQEDLTLQLAESESEKNLAIRERILGEIEEYNKEKGYDFILGYSLSSDVVYADERLDITSEILERLNSKYQLESAKK